VRTPDELYRLEPNAREQEGVPVLVHTLQGMMDAGHAGALVASHLLNSLPSERLATFDADQLIDYRSRRPAMTFESTGWVGYDAPEIVIDLLRDATGNPFLLLHGAEPDLQWERFTEAVMEIVQRLGVRTTIGVHGIPMGVPHTRPTTVTAHATRPDLVAGHPAIFGTIQVPGSAGAHLELRLGQRGHDALGFAANVPHYLTQTHYPQAAAELIRQIAKRARLTIPVGELEAAGREVTAAIDRQVAESEEIGAVVHALEQQFDAFVSSDERSSLLAAPTEIPTPEEIGAEFEAFLAEHARSRDAEADDEGPRG
jgi:proteasome assembly chaperone (PAC2) family protein